MHALRADIANFCWVVAGPLIGLDLAEYPNLQAWVKKIMAREAVQEGLKVPESFMMQEVYDDAEKMKKMIEEAQAKRTQAPGA